MKKVIRKRKLKKVTAIFNKIYIIIGMTILIISLLGFLNLLQIPKISIKSGYVIGPWFLAASAVVQKLAD